MNMIDRIKEAFFEEAGIKRLISNQVITRPLGDNLRTTLRVCASFEIGPVYKRHERSWQSGNHAD
jgi:hypothetical protein